MIQLNLTSDGLAAKTRNNNLIFTKFVIGSGADDDGHERHGAHEGPSGELVLDQDREEHQHRSQQQKVV